MLHGACVREEAGARNRAFSRVKWLQPAMKGTSAAAAAAVVPTVMGSSSVFCVVLCVS